MKLADRHAVWKPRMSIKLLARFQRNIFAHKAENALRLSAEFGKLIRIERLGTVTERFIRLMMHLDHQSVRAHRHRRPAEGDHLVPAPGGMTGIDDDGEMAFPLDIRHGRQIQCVAAVMNKGAHASLSENYLCIPALHNVLRRHEPFVDGRRHTPFEHYRST